MLVTNLTRYDLCTQDDNGDMCEGYMDSSVDGEYVKFEEAMEASSNSLQQLKAAIALWSEFIASTPTPKGVSEFLHRNMSRINAVVAQQHT